MEEILPYKSVEPHLKTLRAGGLYQLDPKRIRYYKTLHKFYMSFVISFILTFTVQQIIKVYQVRDDVNKAMETVFLLLTNSDFLYKQFILWWRQDQVEELLDMLKNPLFHRNEPKHRELLLSTSRQAIVLLRVFNIAALATCFLWVLYPMILYVQHKHVEFTVWLPFDPNESPQFYYAIIYMWIQTSWLAVGNTSMDTFITYMFAQCKTQLSILRLDFETIIKSCEEEAKETLIPFISIYYRKFRTMLLHYNAIVQLAYKSQEVFSGAIFYFMLVSGWIMCTSAYRIINIDPTSIAFLSMILYIMCILIEIYLYCYFGNELTHESEQLMESAFTMDWSKLPAEHRVSLIIFMERIKRPILLTAGFMIPLSNTTFISILRSSYTFYAFLKNTE